MSSALGEALGMSSTYTWTQVISAITGVVNRGTLNWSGSNTTYVLSSGYYIGGTLDSRPSYTNGYNTGVSAADNRVNTSSASYSSGYNNGYSVGNSAGYNSGYNAGVAAGAANTRVVKQLTLSVTASSDQRAFVDNDKDGNTTNCRYIAVNPGLTAYTVTYIYWLYNNYHLCVGCFGSAGNAGFALSTFHLGSTNNSAKNLVPQYSGGTFYLPTGSGSGVAHTVHFYYV